MHDFRSLARLLEEREELVRIRRPVNPKFEMPALMEQLDGQRRAFLFESVIGSPFPVIGGLLNRYECYGWALGAPLGQPFGASDLDARIEAAKAGGIPPRQVPAGPAQEVVRRDAEVDLGTLPVPTFFEHDTGPFITAACGIARDGDSGMLNVGIYRTLITGRNTMVVNASSLSDLRVHYRAAAGRNEPMPIALAIGVEPALLMAAACKLRRDQSELDVAGALNGAPIELVKCRTSDLLVPASAEIVIEGQVDFSSWVENTLGEFAGQYGPESAPVTRVTAITHRSDALFHSILAGRNPEHNTLGSVATFALQRALAGALRGQFPRLVDVAVHFDPRLGSMGHIAISLRKRDNQEPLEVARAVFRAAGGFFPVGHITKRVIIVDDDVDVHDLADVEWAVWTRTAQASRYQVIPDVQSWELERCARPGDGSLRIAIDATMDEEDRERLCRPVIPGAEHIRLEDYIARRPAA